MFTGIVEELGTVAAIEDQGDAIRLSIHASTVLEDAGLGDSISVNGCCLTITTYDAGTWTADVMQETLDKTSLHGVRPGDRVNLERAVTADKRLGGHIVQGHVDGVSLTVVEAGTDRFTVSLIPETLARTTLGARQPGDRVNLEVDIIAKYVERLLPYTGEHK